MPDAYLPTFGTPEPGSVYTDRIAAYAVIRQADTIAAVRSASGLYFLPEAARKAERHPRRQYTGKYARS